LEFNPLEINFALCIARIPKLHLKILKPKQMKKALLFMGLAFFGGVSVAQTNLTTAVDFTVTDLEGESHTLFDYLEDGKYVCLDFFAYWCGPCQATAPEFNEVFHMYGCNAGDVIFLSLEYEGTDTQTHDFETAWSGENPPPAASGIDGGAATPHSDYGISAFPTFILIAPDGTIVEQDIWPMDSDILDGVLAQYNIPQMACSVGVDENIAALEVNAFPVPAQDQITVQLDGSISGASIDVYSVIGENVISLVATSTKEVIDVSSLEVGNYILSVQQGSQTKRQMISILR
jgi:thiol-disulfide isomerase/thioredoxin